MVCSVLTVIGGGDTATCCAKYGTEDKVPVCVRVLCVCVCLSVCACGMYAQGYMYTRRYRRRHARALTSACVCLPFLCMHACIQYSLYVHACMHAVSMCTHACTHSLHACIRARMYEQNVLNWLHRTCICVHCCPIITASHHHNPIYHCLIITVTSSQHHIITTLSITVTSSLPHYTRVHCCARQTQREQREGDTTEIA